MALNDNLPLFSSSKITAIVHAMPTKAWPTPSAWNHRVSDFIPMAPNSNEEQPILLTTLLEMELVGLPNAGRVGIWQEK